MFTLLPEQYIKKIRAEYRLRLLTVLVFALSVIVIVGAGALVPAFMLSRTQQTQAGNELADLKKNRALKGYAEVERSLLSANTLVGVLKTHNDSMQLSSLVEAVLGHKKGQINFSAIEVSRGASSSASINLSGVAATREALVAFKKDLEKDPRFTKVDFPPSALAKSKNVQFVMSVQGVGDF